MRRELVRVLNNNQKDVFSEIALRGFWSHGPSLAGVSQTCSEPPMPDAPRDVRVIDLAEWARERANLARR
jgi:hypothetical protein